MKEKLDGVFQALQTLQITPNEHNIKILCCVYDTLRDIYTELEVMENERKTNNNE